MMFNKLANKLFGKIKSLKIAVDALPAIAAIALLSTGAALIYLPAGLIVAGLLLVWVDSRL